MRVGLLSDVHANLSALLAVLHFLEERGVDRFLVAGDIVGYGGQPNECIEKLVEVNAQCVAGNHDLFVLDTLPPTKFPAIARRSAELTRSLLSADARSFLALLPLSLRLQNVFMTHGSIDSPEEYVMTKSRAFELLSQLPKVASGTDTLVLGHTHHQWCVSADHGPLRARHRVQLPGTGVLINPGSVGQSRERERRPRARCALYDSSSSYASFFRIDYDVESSLDVLRRLSLPNTCLHSPPLLRRQLVGLTRRLQTRLHASR